MSKDGRRAAEADVLRSSGGLTPYAGRNPAHERKAVAVVSGARYLLGARRCVRCMHSTREVDRSPLSCRIGLCDLPLPPDFAARLEAARECGTSALSRFYFLQRSAWKREIPDRACLEVLLDDVRVVDADDDANCFFLTNVPGLYRVRDLAWLLASGADPSRYVPLPFASRDRAVAAWRAKSGGEGLR